MQTTKTVNPKLADIRNALIEAVHEGFTDPKVRSRASFLNVALSLIKAHGGPDEVLSPEEAEERVAALRATLPRLPDLPPYEGEDQDEQE